MKSRFFVAAFFFSIASPSLAAAQSPFASVDPASAECLDCHQDSVTVNEPLRICHQGDCDHPIGASYEALASKNRGLTPPGQLDPALKLSNGKMGCLTCHVPYSAADHETVAASRGEGAQPDPMLVMDNTGSGLCVACHKK
ncbi:MAG: hypothetical protein IT362_05050 [Deltaproteobacteria bacterium]|nr:hypothetical protein [Deltaproteobacteria bacterium]